MSRIKKLFLIIFSPILLLFSKAKDAVAISVPPSPSMSEGLNQLAYGTPRQIYNVPFIMCLGYMIILIIPGIKAWKRIRNIRKQQNTKDAVYDEKTKQAMEQEIKYHKTEIIILSIAGAIGIAVLIYIIIQYILLRNY